RLGEGALRTGQGLAGLRAAAAACLSPAGQLQVATALDMIAALEARMDILRKQLRAAARQLTGAKVLAARLYGVGPVTALALTCGLGGAGRFSSSAKAVRFTGLDITVWSSDRKGPPGRLSRQGPPVLRWAVYEAGKTHARAAAPDHGYYAQVKDRKNGKRAALSEARKIIRHPCHLLPYPADPPPTPSPRPRPPQPSLPSLTPPARRARRSPAHPTGTSRGPLPPRACQPLPACPGPGGRPG